ncbi:MAG TPA: TlpA disulfide reductase family protein [Polyangia bacterium]|nr:TlpA disulfide reductase family protein [Polyangia bacterium]
MRSAKPLLLAALLLSSAAEAQVKKGDRAADFQGKTLGGETLKLSSLRGKVVLLDFWASWCEPCKKELPLLAKMAPRLKQRGIEIIAVNIDENRGNAEAFMRSHNLALTVVPDTDKSIVGKYEPPKMPSSFVVDRSGIVRSVNDGFEPGDESKIEQQLTDLAK